MRYLLDTNSVSEFSKRRRNPNATAWFDSKSNWNFYISVLTFGELHRGAAMIERRDPDRAKSIRSWISEVERTYINRTLPVTQNIAIRWGVISAGRTKPVADTLIAATAIEHGLVLVTRNVKDIRDTGVDYVNPFEL